MTMGSKIVMGCGSRNGYKKGLALAFGLLAVAAAFVVVTANGKTNQSIDRVRPFKIVPQQCCFAV